MQFGGPAGPGKYWQSVDQGPFDAVAMAATAHLTSVAPDNEKFTVLPAPARLPRRKPNAEYRSREHLTEREVERLIEAMKGNRWGTVTPRWS
jgi:hypothetical protein